MPFPEDPFADLARRLPPHPAWLLPLAAGLGLLGAAAAVALHQPWIGAGLLLAGVIAAGLAGPLASPWLPLGLMLPPFGFALADPSRALAAMFLTFALAVLAVLGRGHVSAVTWLVAVALLLSCILPDYFSLLAYLIGITAFVAAGQGIARGLR